MNLTRGSDVAEKYGNARIAETRNSSIIAVAGYSLMCLCRNCTANPAQTYSEEFRHETEVRFVAKQNDEWIKEFLEGVKKKRGEAAWMKLRMDVIRAWRNKDAGTS